MIRVKRKGPDTVSVMSLEIELGAIWAVTISGILIRLTRFCYYKLDIFRVETKKTKVV